MFGVFLANFFNSRREAVSGTGLSKFYVANSIPVLAREFAMSLDVIAFIANLLSVRTFTLAGHVLTLSHFNR